MNKKTEIATLAGGCFWCLEEIYGRVKGVIKVVSGYVGGITKDPTYEQVCSGSTGHAEAVQITFNPQVISYQDILNIFWQIHNPTTKNRQGHDIGTQYRSVIFYHDEVQKEIAEKSKKDLEDSNVWESPIVTEILPVEEFYQAETYHQNYYKNNPYNSYCQFVVKPKVNKFLRDFDEYIK